MKVKASALGVSAGIITAIGFGLCGLLFAIAPGPTAAFVSWVLHVDVTAMTRPVSAANLLAGIVLFAGYVGLFVGVTAALYNRISTPRGVT